MVTRKKIKITVETDQVFILRRSRSGPAWHSEHSNEADAVDSEETEALEKIDGNQSQKEKEGHVLRIHTGNK